MLTKNQEKLIIACLLGDGYLTKHFPKKANPRLEIQHCGKQKKYLIWKRDLLKTNGLNVSEIYDVSKNGHEAYRFYVKLDKEDGISLRHRFYPNGNKTISRHDLNKLDAECIAIWFMDDGGRRISWNKEKNKCVGRSLHLATHSFTLDENIIIQHYFETAWGVHCNIRSDRGKYYISINATNAKTFIAIIKDFILEDLLYKIDLKYVNKEV